MSQINICLFTFEQLKAVMDDMNVRFKDPLDLEVFPWLVEPFASNVNECDSTTQEMLIDPQSYIETHSLEHLDRQAIKRNNRFAKLWRK